MSEIQPTVVWNLGTDHGGCRFRDPIEISDEKLDWGFSISFRWIVTNSQESMIIIIQVYYPYDINIIEVFAIPTPVLLSLNESIDIIL